jgi:group I intron endonuclease
MSAGIYRIKNIITNSVYIGYSTNLQKRLVNYKTKSVDSQPLIFNSLKDYGVENHLFEILVDFEDKTPSINELKSLEAAHIKQHKYALKCTMLNSNEGGGGCSRWSNDKKNKESLKRKGINLRLGKEINQYDLDGKFISTWKSISLASRKLKIDYNLLIRCCKNSTNGMAGGFQWRYAHLIGKEDIQPYLKILTVKPILQYDLEGNFIKKWNSVIEAAKHLNMRPAVISGLLTGKLSRPKYGIGKSANRNMKYAQAYSFQWRYFDGDIVHKIGSIFNTKILQYSVEGNFIHEWDNNEEIEKCLGINKKKLNSALNKSTKKCGGFQWRYSRDGVIPESIESLRKNEYTHETREYSYQKIFQFGLDGKFIKEWNYPYEIEKVTNIRAESITKACKGLLKTTGKFQWRYGYDCDGVLSLPPIKIISQLDLDGNLLNEFMTLKEIGEKLQLRTTLISRCLHGFKDTFAGYRWTYKK